MSGVVVRRVLDRIHGIEWRFALFDFGNQLGVAAQSDDGRRAAVRFVIPRERLPEGASRIDEDVVISSVPDIVEKAKDQVRKALKEGRGVRGDDVLEGHEEWLID